MKGAGSVCVSAGSVIARGPGTDEKLENWRWPKGALVRRRQISPNAVIATEFLRMLRALLAACTARVLGGVPSAGAWRLASRLGSRRSCVNHV